MKKTKTSVASTKGNIKAALVQLDLDEDTHEAMLFLVREQQRLINSAWKIWISYHTIHRTEQKIIEYLKVHDAWKEADKKTRGKKPKPSYDPFPETDWQLTCKKREGSKPANLIDDIYHYCCEAFPEMIPGNIICVLSKWRKTIISRKAAKGSLPGWSSILLGNEGIPSFNKAQPICLDKRNFEIVDQEGDFWLFFKARRTGPGQLVRDRGKLFLNKKQCMSYRDKIKNMVYGVDGYECKGSQIVREGRKWFISVSYTFPKEDLHFDHDRTLTITPEVDYPFSWQIDDDEKFSFMDRSEKFVERSRQRIERQRKDRNKQFKNASQSRKGKGAKRARAANARMSNSWNNVVSNINRELAAKAVWRCKKDGIGTIVYQKPRIGKDLCLSRAGVQELLDEGIKVRSNWQWHQLESKLQNAAGKFGIKVVVCEHPLNSKEKEEAED